MWGSPAYTGKEQERTHFHTVGWTEHPLASHQNKCGVRRVKTHSNKCLLLLWAPEVSCDLTHPTASGGCTSPRGLGDVKATGVSPVCPLPRVLCTAEGEWEHRAFPTCRAFLLLRAKSGGSPPGALFPCCLAEHLASGLKKEHRRCRRRGCGSLLLPLCLTPCCFTVLWFPLSQRTEKSCPISWLGRGLKNLGHGSSQAERGGGGSIIFPSLLLFSSPPFPATSPARGAHVMH